MSFTAEEDERLIDCVQRKRLLYRKDDEEYRNFTLRAAAWVDIGDQVGKCSKYHFAFFSFVKYCK